MFGYTDIPSEISGASSQAQVVGLAEESNNEKENNNETGEAEVKVHSPLDQGFVFCFSLSCLFVVLSRINLHIYFVEDQCGNAKPM